jgi:ribonuclease HII
MIDHPEYDFVNNKGYGTPKHRSALAEYGAISEHRRSFLGSIALPKKKIKISKDGGVII